MSVLAQLPGVDLVAVEPPKPCRRGTSNSNERGSSKTRRQRREWLIETYRADVDIWETEVNGRTVTLEIPSTEGMGDLYGDGWRKACRCYRCGVLLTVDTVTADRIKPGAEGGKYRTPLRDQRDGVTNIRPACGFHNSSTGGLLAAARRGSKGA